MKKILILAAFLICQTIFSQSYSISYSANGAFLTLKPLIKEKKIYGYVEMRLMDKKDSITNVYKYIILDKNMNKINEGNLSENIYKKDYYQRVTDIEYNNGFIIFSFMITYYNNFSGAYYNIANSFQILDVEKNKITTSQNPDKLFDINVTNNRLDKNFKFHEYHQLSPNGFLIGNYNRKTKENAYYAIDFDGKEVWKQDLIEKNDEIDVIYNLIEKDDKNIILLCTKFKKEKKISDEILVLETKTGAKVSVTPLINENYTLRYLDITIKNSKLQIVGRFYEKNKIDEVNINESLGIYRKIIDLKTGLVDSDIYLPYSKFNSLEIADNGKVKKEGYLYFQTVDLNPDGSYFFMAETSVGGKNFNQVYIFMLDPDFNPIKVERFDTKRTRGSKYAFSQDLPNDVGKAYFFYDKTDEMEYELNVINYLFDSKTFTKTKMDLKSEKSNIRIIPAKAGYVGVIEYFKDPKKEGKSMEIRLEKLNYERQ
jgi:hypothetical protein